VPAVVILLGIGFWLWLYFRYGREYREANPPQYVHEPLEGWRPVEVGYLWRWGKLNLQDITAMLMDLIQRGVLQVVAANGAHHPLRGLLGTAVEEPQYIERARDLGGVLSPSERYLIEEIIFQDAGPSDRVRLDGFRRYADTHPVTAQDKYAQWRRLAKAEWRRQPLIDPASNAAMGAGVAVGVVMLVSVFFLGMLPDSALGIVPAYVGVLLGVASPLLRRRSSEAAYALHRWQAFRRYLADFSQLSKEPMPAIVLWEQYLVFAVALGVAGRVIGQLKALYPQMVSSEPMLGP
jgi:hypothetical protein